MGKLVSVDQWYLNFLVSLEEALEEQDVWLDTSVRRWWKENSDLGPSKRFSLFVEKVLLAEVSERIVVFVDEIDTDAGACVYGRLFCGDSLFLYVAGDEAGV